MRSQALGLDVSATAATRGTQEAGDGVLSLGNAASHVGGHDPDRQGEQGRRQGRRRRTAVSKASQVDLLGLISIDAVVTDLEARSDAVKGASSGSTVVSGLTVAGQGFVVDDKGVRPEGVPAPRRRSPASLRRPTCSRPWASRSIRSARSTPASGAKATRVASGLRISVDTVLLRKTINMVPALNDALGGVFGQVPVLPGVPLQPQGLLFYTLSATPKITFVIGQADATAAATLPIPLDFPVTAPLPGVPLGGGTPGIPGTPAVAALPGTPGGPLEVLSAPQAPTSVGAPVATTELGAVRAAGNDRPDPFAGVAPILFLGGLLLAAAGARGLLGVQSAVLGGAVLGAPGCALGAPAGPTRPPHGGVPPGDATVTATPAPSDPFAAAAGRTGLRARFSSVDQVLNLVAAVLLPLGLVIVVLGWYGASHTPYLFEQVPYLVSGGLLGLGFVLAGGFLLFGSWIARTGNAQQALTRELLDAVREVREQLATMPEPAGPAPVADSTPREQTARRRRPPVNGVREAPGAALPSTPAGPSAPAADARTTAGRRPDRARRARGDRARVDAAPAGLRRGRRPRGPAPRRRCVELALRLPHVRPARPGCRCPSMTLTALVVPPLGRPS